MCRNDTYATIEYKYTDTCIHIVISMISSQVVHAVQGQNSRWDNLQVHRGVLGVPEAQFLVVLCKSEILI